MAFFRSIVGISFSRLMPSAILSSSIIFNHRDDKKSQMINDDYKKKVLDYCDNENFSYCKMITNLHLKQMMMHLPPNYTSPEKRNGKENIGFEPTRSIRRFNQFQCLLETDPNKQKIVYQEFTSGQSTEEKLSIENFKKLQDEAQRLTDKEKVTAHSLSR